MLFLIQICDHGMYFLNNSGYCYKYYEVKDLYQFGLLHHRSSKANWAQAGIIYISLFSVVIRMNSA